MANDSTILPSAQVKWTYTKQAGSERLSGVAEGNRTPDLLGHNQAL
jgi:hypothetical protein